MNAYDNYNPYNDTDFDKYFDKVYNLCNINFSHDELIEMLKSGDVASKQIAAIKFDYVKSEDDAYALISNLTGCDGKIREAVAQKIFSVLSSDILSRQYFANISSEIFADAVIDINANICRLVIDSSLLLNNYFDFSANFTKKTVKHSIDALDELDKFVFRDKKYVINKQLFKLYWSLEAINYFYNFVDINLLENILKRCCLISEYTIREKTARIINTSGQFSNLKSILINDDNYYVREVFKSSMPL